jgi:hypothetical protein
MKSGDGNWLDLRSRKTHVIETFALGCALRTTGGRGIVSNISLFRAATRAPQLTRKNSSCHACFIISSNDSSSRRRKPIFS